jgi:Resolvase, N terminal domain
MVDWRIAETLAVDTRQAVTRWWARRHSAAAAIPAGLVEDLQAARLALDEDLQRRLRDVATILPEPQRADLTKRIAELDPWHVMSEMAAGRAQPDPAAAEREASIEDQLEVCRRYVERQGWTVVEVYTDQALSGASRFRPAFQQMLADAEQRRFDVVVVEALDRLSTASARLKWGSDQTYGRVSTAVGRRADLPCAGPHRLVVTRRRHSQPP